MEGAEHGLWCHRLARGYIVTNAHVVAQARKSASESSRDARGIGNVLSQSFLNPLARLSWARLPMLIWRC